MNLQPQSEPRGGGGGEAFPKKRISKREIKKRLSIQPSKIIKKVAARNYFSALDTASNRYRRWGLLRMISMYDADLGYYTEDIPYNIPV
jgi:hypothetical protein